MNLAYYVADPPKELQRNLPPVILLHGMTDSKMTWALLAPKIAIFTGRKVYYLDARNHGDSPHSEEMNFDILADDVGHFMDQQNIPKAVLVGHSMGGKMALTLAIRRPDKVEKLITEDIGTANLPSSVYEMIVQMLKVFHGTFNQFPEGTDEITVRKTIAQIMANSMKSNGLQLTEEEKSFFALQIPIRKEENSYTWKCNFDAIEKTLLTKGNYDQTLDGQYLGDALFLYGPKSEFLVSKDEDQIKQLFPNARLVAVEGAGHLLHFGYAEDFLREVVNFINGCQTIQAKVHS